MGQESTSNGNRYPLEAESEDIGNDSPQIRARTTLCSTLYWLGFGSPISQEPNHLITARLR